jgi:Domain of unknown function (DUF5916)/Carbohydrate family 9 binding domain-like
MSAAVMRTRAGRGLLPCTVAVLWTGAWMPGPAAWAGAAPELPATRTETAPVIDGSLDDAAWTQATPISDFVQFFPREGAPPSHETEVRVLYDDVALYVALRMFDSAPDRIVGAVSRRDRDVESDWIYVGIDSQRDGTTGYGFRVNAAGIQYDELLYDDTLRSSEWDAVWSSAVRRDEQGWSCELALPLNVLRFWRDQTQSWGFQIIRYISRTRETVHWRLMPSSGRGLVSRFGTLTGLRALTPSRTLELRPYVLGQLAHTSGDDEPWQPDGALGVDLKLGITSALTLDVAANPDFGQVEADEVVLNLTRFETFLPEKRPFFLERSDIFTTPLQVFYSRRIGQPLAGVYPGAPIADRGEALTAAEESSVPGIYGAGKLTGRLTERVSMGALFAVTGPERVSAAGAGGAARTVDVAPARSQAAVRGLYSFGSASSVGMVATAATRLGGDVQDAYANHDEYVQGVDGQWQSRDGHWRVIAQGLISERVGGTAYRTPEGRPCPAAGADCVPITRTNGTRMRPGSVGAGGLLSASSHSASWFTSLEYQVASPQFDINALGFHQPFDHHSLDLRVGHQALQPRGIFQSYSLSSGTRGVSSFDGTLLDGEIWMEARGELNERAAAGNSAYMAVFGRPSGTWDIHETFDGARFERPWRIGSETGLATDPRQALSGTASMLLARGPAGERELVLSGNALVRAGERVQVDLTMQLGRNDALRFVSCFTDAGADCDPLSADRTYVFAGLDTGFLSLTARGSLAFSPRLSLQAYAQMFLARGQFQGYREHAASGWRPRLERDQLVASAYMGDFDGDFVKDDDFQEASLNATAVLRWELRPGSILHAVYARAQSGARDLAGALPRLELAGLGAADATDIILLKLVYFWS